ncbi:MAG: hypothetical protein KDA96_05775 [Planctomycetaceae bacterium]|nr:hypothetical protein [Planctomycetaceae bacterium]
MAKRDSAFNMSEEIRALLTANNEMTGRDVINALKKKFPKASINDASCQVAYSNSRKKLGIVKTVKRRPGKARPGRPAKAAVGALDLQLLKAAKGLLEQCGGDANVAAEALRSVASLQMK